MLEWWEAQGTFEQLRARNRGGPTFSFMDGPITANNPAGVHHGLGPDTQGRLPALQGAARLRPALPERLRLPGALGRGRGREVTGSQGEEGHRGVRPGRVRAQMPRARRPVYSEVMTDQFRRLGQWMDWDNDYFTFSDTNIEYIWRFLKTVQERDWLYKGHRSTQWCPRCGTSLSQHEQAGEENYVDMEHPSLFVRFPLVGRQGESLVVWTTTPWTLPANVAAAVQPDAEYGLAGDGALGRGRALSRTRASCGPCAATELVGSRYHGPFDELEAQEGVDASRHPVGRGVARRGDRHRPHRAGRRRRGLRARRASTTCRCSPRSTRRGGCCAEYGELAGFSTDEMALRRRRNLHARGLLVERGDERPPISRSAGAARLRSSSGSSTTGSSPPMRSGSRCSTQTTRSSGRRPVHRQADGRLASQHG